MSEPYAFIKIKPSPEAIPETSQPKRHFESTKSLLTAIGGLLADAHSSISLEIVAKNDTITYLLVVAADVREAVTHHLYATMPGAELEDLDEWSLFDQQGEMAGATIQFTPDEADLLSTEFTGTDPLQPVLEVLSGVPATDRLCLQLVLEPAAQDRGLAQRAIEGLHNGMVQGLREFVIGPTAPTDTQPEPENKMEHALFRASFRVIALSGSKSGAESLVRRAAASYHGLTVPGKTKLRYRLTPHLESWLDPAIRRHPDRHGRFILTAAEAANFYHTPLRPRAFPKLDMVSSTRLPIPEISATGGPTIGFAAFRGDHRPISLSPEDRLRHTYVIGSTGTGKSTLLQSMVLQDMEAGDGCCFIDPHGEAIDWLLPRIPKHRAQDVILFDPSDPQGILGLNLLEWRTPEERDLLIQELILLFYKLFDPGHTGIIGPQFEHWLRNAALTITEPQIRGTLVDIPRLFTDPKYAADALAVSDHWAVKDFWGNQMARTADFHKSEMLNYFTSKFGSFLGNSVMHQILSQRTSAFDMRTLMDRRKILLVNLSKGKLGSLNAQLLGSLIVAKIQLAAMSRADSAPEHRPPFYVYIDEFQNVVTDSFAQMLSEVRKYGVGLHLAHQYVDQLPENIKQAVSGNVGTIMAFRLGHSDAAWLAPHMAPLTADDLTNIPPYHYHLRTLANGQLTTPFTVQAPVVNLEPQPALESALRGRVREFVAHSRASQSTPA